MDLAVGSGNGELFAFGMKGEGVDALAKRGKVEGFIVFLFGDVEGANAAINGGENEAVVGKGESGGFDAATSDDGGAELAFGVEGGGANFAIVGGGEEAFAVGGVDD